MSLRSLLLYYKQVKPLLAHWGTSVYRQVRRKLRDLSYSDNERKSHRFSYQELSDNEHRNALNQVFSSSEVLPYGELIVILKEVYAEIVGRALKK